MCPLITDYCTTKHFIALFCNFPKLLNSIYSMSLHLFPICVHNLVLFWLPVKAGQKKSKHIILVRLTVTIHNALSLQFHIRNISRTVSLYSQNIFWLEYFKCILSGKLTNVQHFQNSCLYFRGCHFPCTQQQSCPSYTQQWFNNTTM